MFVSRMQIGFLKDDPTVRSIRIQSGNTSTKIIQPISATILGVYISVSLTLKNAK